MKNRTMMHLAIAAAMQTMQGIPQKLATVGHRISAGGTGPGGRRRTRKEGYRRASASKYTSHQGKQECARRLRPGSAAWHAARCM
jgi:hypothetical protein